MEVGRSYAEDAPKGVSDYRSLLAASNRWTKDRRIRRRRDFIRVSQGKRFATTNFLVSYAAGEGRIGITVTKRVGNAVVRNRIKRQVREVMRKQPRFEEVDIVIVAKKSAANLHLSLVERQLIEAFASMPL